MLLESTSAKAVRITLMKFTLDVRVHSLNFIFQID